MLRSHRGAKTILACNNMSHKLDGALIFFLAGFLSSIFHHFIHCKKVILLDVSRTREFVFCSMSRCRSHKMKLIANYHFCILTHKINLINRWNWFGGKLNLKGRPALDKSQHVSRLLIVCPTFGSHVSSVNNSQLENGGGGGSHRKEWNSEGFIGTTRQFPPSEDQTLPQLPDYVC